MSTYVNIACTLFVSCFVLTALLVPAVMWFARRIDAVDRGGYRKVFQGEMPLLGGLAIAIPLVLLGLATGAGGHLIVRNWQWVWRHYRESFDLLFSLASNRSECLILATGAVAIVALGLVDDTRGMRATTKLLGQVAVAAFSTLAGFTVTTVSVPFLGAVELGVGVGGVLTILWIVGLTNALNLIDGIDGLAAGIAFIGTAALVVLSIIQHNALVMLAGAALAGSLLAFLIYNFPPARIFLGDTGSMFLGYSVAMVSLMGLRKSETAVIVLAPILALSLPVFETLISIIRRYLRGVPVFTGDSLHTHHRLLGKGYSQPRVVLTLYATGLLLAAAAVLSAAIPEESSWAWCPYALYVATLAGITWLAGYLRPTTFRAAIARRHRNKLLQALGHYAALRLNDDASEVEPELLLELCRQELGLRRLEVYAGGALRWAASADGASPGGAAPTQGRLRVKSCDGEDVFILYEFKRIVDDNTRLDASSCLAGIFDQLRTGPANPSHGAGPVSHDGRPPAPQAPPPVQRPLPRLGKWSEDGGGRH